MSTALRSSACWRDVATSQDGVLSRRQAIVLGFGEEAWQWRLDTRRWQAVYPGVAVTHDGPVSFGQHVWAGVLYAGRGAAVSGAAGLVTAGLSKVDASVVDVAIPEERKVRGQPAVGPDGETRPALAPHRTRGLAALVHVVAEPPRVVPARCVVDAAAWAPSDRAAELFVVAPVQQRLVRIADVRTQLAAAPRSRRRALVEEVLDDAELGATARSELTFLRLLRRHRLPVPDRMQRLVRAHGVRYLDAAWDGQRLVAEIDGAHHREARTWDADTLRSNDVVLAHRSAGVAVVRFTTGNLRHDEASVVRQLRGALL